MIFEGEYLNGERWNGKEYYSNGDIKAEYKEGHAKYYSDNSFIII